MILQDPIEDTDEKNTAHKGFETKIFIKVHAAGVQNVF